MSNRPHPCDLEASGRMPHWGRVPSRDTSSAGWRWAPVP